MHGLSDESEELLEALWVEIKEKNKRPDLGAFKDENILKELVEKGYIDTDKPVLLTDKGLKEAEKCIRRHRLAERLLTDILDVKERVVHEVSCKFEHGLHHGVEDNICVLLGHPKTCPHGKLIPAGDCCEKAEKTPRRLIVPLKELSLQEVAKITYINTQEADILKKLIGMGILPGNQIRLLHRFPSFVFEMGKSHFAVDNELAEHIYVLPLKR